MTPSPYRIATPAPKEAQACARKRARTSVWISVGMVGIGYVIWLPLAAHEAFLYIPVPLLPFVRSFILIASDTRPEAKAGRGEAIGLLTIGTFFGIWGIWKGMFAIAESFGWHDDLTLQAIVFLTAVASLLPIIGLHRAEFRRLRLE